MTLGMWMPGGFEVVVILLVLLLTLLGTAFWVWMLVDCAINETLERNSKVTWVIVIAVTSWLGALVYFFVGRRGRSRA